MDQSKKFARFSVTLVSLWVTVFSWLILENMSLMLCVTDSLELTLELILDCPLFSELTEPVEFLSKIMGEVIFSRYFSIDSGSCPVS